MVAVKIFKSQITSDGLPLDEMNICLRLGTHPNLIQIVGKSDRSLIFELIPSEFKILGNPPNFQTCTRDTFKDSTHFSFHQIKNILSDIASACIHLHSKGIIHGDLYAHNILTNNEGHCILTDFGAASLYNKYDKEANLFERIEVRAFGYLIEDLLNHSDIHHSELIKLKNTCLNDNISDRPVFNDIMEILITI